MLPRVSIVLLCLCSCVVTACGGGGGGGGGGSAVGAARVEIELAPKKLDVGDRTTIEIKIREVHPDGITLKVRYPDALSYVTESAALEVDDRAIDASPSVNVTGNSNSYLVFTLDPDDLGQDNRGTLQFELVAQSELADGLVEVDPDVDDSSSFDIENPEFSEEAKARIEIVG